MKKCLTRVTAQQNVRVQVITHSLYRTLVLLCVCVSIRYHKARRCESQHHPWLQWAGVLFACLLTPRPAHPQSQNWGLFSCCCYGHRMWGWWTTLWSQFPMMQLSPCSLFCCSVCDCSHSHTQSYTWIINLQLRKKEKFLYMSVISSQNDLNILFILS